MSLQISTRSGLCGVLGFPKVQASCRSSPKQLTPISSSPSPACFSSGSQPHPTSYFSTHNQLYHVPSRVQHQRQPRACRSSLASSSLLRRSSGSGIKFDLRSERRGIVPALSSVDGRQARRGSVGGIALATHADNFSSICRPQKLGAATSAGQRLPKSGVPRVALIGIVMGVVGIASFYGCAYLLPRPSCVVSRLTLPVLFLRQPPSLLPRPTPLPGFTAPRSWSCPGMTRPCTTPTARSPSSSVSSAVNDRTRRSSLTSRTSSLADRYRNAEGHMEDSPPPLNEMPIAVCPTLFDLCPMLEQPQ